MEGSAAEKAGIKPDDKIVAINGDEILKFQDIVTHVTLNLDRPMKVKVLHATGVGEWKGEPVELTVTPKLVEESDRFGFRHTKGLIGIARPPARWR
jgi:regulator of sigma E protease